MLLRDTVTFSRNNGLRPITINLVLVPPGLQAAMIQCKTSDTDHGGDHRVIEARFRMSWEARATRRLGRTYDKADWADISRAVSLLPQPQLIQTRQQLNDEAERFVKGISQIVADKIPYAKPHPNAKRWWTPALTALRLTLSALRNRETERRRRDLDCKDLHRQIQAVRKDYYSQIAGQKAAHWREFVDSPERNTGAGRRRRRKSCGTPPGLFLTTTRARRREPRRQRDFPAYPGARGDHRERSSCCNLPVKPKEGTRPG